MAVDPGWPASPSPQAGLRPVEDSDEDTARRCGQWRGCSRFMVRTAGEPASLTTATPVGRDRGEHLPLGANSFARRREVRRHGGRRMNGPMARRPCLPRRRQSAVRTAAAHSAALPAAIARRSPKKTPRRVLRGVKEMDLFSSVGALATCHGENSMQRKPVVLTLLRRLTSSGGCLPRSDRVRAAQGPLPLMSFPRSALPATSFPRDTEGPSTRTLLSPP